MSEQNGPSQNGQQPWYLSQDYFNAKMNERTALSIGQAVLDNIAASVRAEMAEGRLADLRANLWKIEAEVAAMRSAEVAPADVILHPGEGPE